MVIIVSDKFDSSTNRIIDWMLFYEAKFVRVNEEDTFALVTLRIVDNQLSMTIKMDDQLIDTNDVTGFWYRRGRLQMNLPSEEIQTVPSDIRQDVRHHLEQENETVIQLLYHQLEKKRNSLGGYETSKSNKLACLLKAVDFGLKVPASFICSSKKDIPMNKPLITKGIQSVACFKLGIEYFGNYTEEVNHHHVASFDDIFFPSLFQEKLDKKFEIRSFYIDGEFYSMCIFSQADVQTSVDFRKYNLKKPNRVVPYKLPLSIERSLDKLMKHFDLKTGSIDMVYTKSGDYYFLEVNPIGQFGMVSMPCNYHLEKKIAEFLCQ